MKRLVARFVLWLTDEFCEKCHHFNLTPDGAPGCIGNWRWFGIGPNRWQCWAYDLLNPLPTVVASPFEVRLRGAAVGYTAGSGEAYTYTCTGGGGATYPVGGATAQEDGP